MDSLLVLCFYIREFMSTFASYNLIDHFLMENYQLKDEIFTVLSEVADSIGLECYVIGGYVRDLILERPSNDIDVVVVGSGIDMAQAVAHRLGKGTSLSVFKNFGTAQIKRGHLEVEFVGARKESYRLDSRKPIVEDGTLEDDQNRRDFTINALAICLNKARFGELVDPFGGMRDLQTKIIRTPLDPDITFSDDPLRMMRCVRFATQLNFFIEERTFFAISRNKERISIISRERIADELNKIMASPRPSIGFDLLEKSGLLPLIFPELNRLKGTEEKEGKGHKDNFLHTMQVLNTVAEHSDDIWLRWAAVFHDIGKPSTKKWDDRIGWTFHNHNYIGEKMVSGIFKRMKLPMNEKMKFVQKMVNLHMRPIALVDDGVSDSAVRRLLFDAGDDLDALMLLCDADVTSKNKEKQMRYKENFKLVKRKMMEIDEKDRIRNFQPPIQGEEIMRIFGLSPCREVGDIKTAIKDAVLDGVIPNEYQAAYDFMIQKAKELGLEKKEETSKKSE